MVDIRKSRNRGKWGALSPFSQTSCVLTILAVHFSSALLDQWYNSKCHYSYACHASESLENVKKYICLGPTLNH